MKRKTGKRKLFLYTLITAMVLCAIFASLVAYLYSSEEELAYENLHLQTKQIKDNLVLQLISDQENLQTMANFAAKLYSDGEDYSLLFSSFKPIGLIQNIGILNPDNVFLIKTGSVDLDGLISFSEEAQRGAYISGRVKDLTRDDRELIRSAVPIVVDGKTVGILYGVIMLDTLQDRYLETVQELNGQLFVYAEDTGDLVINTLTEELGNISFLSDRTYNKHYSFSQMMETENGFLAFQSAYKDENMHLHYSSIPELGWTIAFARYDSQVFAKADALRNVMFVAFVAMAIFSALYVLVLVIGDRNANAITACDSEVCKILMESGDDRIQILDALGYLCHFVKGRTVLFFDTDGDEYIYNDPKQSKLSLSEKDKLLAMTQLLRYADDFQQVDETAVGVMRLRLDKLLKKENPAIYALLEKHGIQEVSFGATITQASYTVILAVVDAKKGDAATALAESVVPCFSLALYNRNRYNKTQKAAITDALTGALNRVAYRQELLELENKKVRDFACVYVDVNELHLRNNLYGHTAGDEMLITIANTLKEVFFGHKVYRMGGDEFVVTCRDTEYEWVKQNIALLQERLEFYDYHVSVGMSYRSTNTNTEEMVKEAEERMYREKALFYQKKEQNDVQANEEYIHLLTGIPEIDKFLSVASKNYQGIFRVSLNTDHVKRILMTKNLHSGEDEVDFAKLFTRHIAQDVAPEYRRAITTFINYDALKQQLLEGHSPKLSYRKTNGDSVALSVYMLDAAETDSFDTLWVFELEPKLDK